MGNEWGTNQKKYNIWYIYYYKSTTYSVFKFSFSGSSPFVRTTKKGRQERLLFLCAGCWWEYIGFGKIFDFSLAEPSPLRPHHKRTQNRIQEIVPILRFLLLFGIFALSRHKKHIFDRRSPSSESFCTFVGWAFLFALNLWVIVKIVVKLWLFCEFSKNKNAFFLKCLLTKQIF